jgi:hypothetical protein
MKQPARPLRGAASLPAHQPDPRRHHRAPFVHQDCHRQATADQTDPSAPTPATVDTARLSRPGAQINLYVGHHQPSIQTLEPPSGGYLRTQRWPGPVTERDLISGRVR